MCLCIGATDSSAADRRPSYDMMHKHRSVSGNLGTDDLKLAVKVLVQREASMKNHVPIVPVSTGELEAAEAEAEVESQHKHVDFEKSEGLTSEVAAKRLAYHGRNELPEKKVPK